MKNNQNKIEKLISELCPNGVETETLKKLGDFYGGLSGKSKDDFSNGNAKFISYKNIFANISVDTNVDTLVKVSEGERQNIIQYGDVLFTGSSETPNECGMSSVLTMKTDEPLYLNSFCFGFRLHDTELFLPGFLKYVFRDEKVRKQIAKTANGVTRFNISKKLFAKITIPIPPIEIQKEIVDILDNFTQLEAELEAELEARKKQYEYYREELLTFDEEVKSKPLGDILKRNKGTKITASKMKKLHKENAPLKIFAGGKTFAMVDFEDIPKKDIHEVPSIIVKSRGIIEFEYYDKPFSHKNEFWSYYSDNEEVEIKYIFYFLKIKELYFQSVASRMQMPQISLPDTEKFKIPIPPPAEQKRIVSILDTFDALTNDISIGLPAEISARKKQYEYYRGKLLTFPELKR